MICPIYFLLVGQKMKELERLSEMEITFLETHGAKVVEFPGNHTFDEDDFEEMIAFFRE